MSENSGLPTGVLPPPDGSPTAPDASASPNAPNIPPPGSPGRKAPRRGGRSVRRPEEDMPGPHYVEQMIKLGPRTGESRLAFIGRMAYVKAVREELLGAAERNFGQLADVCREMGISRHNLPNYLRNAGLTMGDIRAFDPESKYR